jgi:hypothetical protein
MPSPWIIAAVLVLVATHATTMPGAEDQKPATSPAEEYRRLVDDYEAGADPREVAQQLLALAKNHAKTPVVLDALVWVLSKRRSHPEGLRALELIERDHLHSEKLDSALAPISRVPSTAVERVLRAVMTMNPQRHVRAQACLQLANVFDQQASVTEQLANQPELTERVLSYYGKSYGEYLKSLERKSLERKREETYELMRKSFADVPAGDETMGQLAEKALFRIRRLSIGRQAPEIEGEDIDGKPFNLSDYRGKVVVLSFWGHW